MRRQDRVFARCSVLTAFLTIMIGFGIFATPSKSHAQNGTTAKAVGIISSRPLVHRMSALSIVTLYAATNQGADPAATPGPESSQPKKVVLPDGDGKAIATEFCQDCHELTTVAKAQQTPEEWRDTVQLMMDRGARLPPEKVDTLVQYLAKNFGPQHTAPAVATPAPAAPPAEAAPATSSQPKKVELPDGDGKAIATEFCQDCHKLTNLTKARKAEEEWRDTVQLMLDRGARLPPEKVDTLVQYLAKNFGPQSSAPASANSPAGSSPAAPVQSK